MFNNIRNREIYPFYDIKNTIKIFVGKNNDNKPINICNCTFILDFPL